MTDEIEIRVAGQTFTCTDPQRACDLAVQLRRAERGDPVTCAQCRVDLKLCHSYRCAECHLWFHLKCIREHFELSKGDN
jgi:hypothetical protein